ncbi:cytidylyl-2-hydroxypropylphosphonate hydrolase [Actinacidiphila paucisporea]|uniref:DUF402 domain-containing protein n=1 Tax=Actinacidiphila paucisporea TaxID=310782 RepID=A0A1M6UJH7_9ACTN|nr:DUF402 domain-containing protein [Actinacidiphila paucisporea]SHK69372.1 hypothetical protein SAMN05216499_101388 [Actinacidiphila paucisporea]
MTAHTETGTATPAGEPQGRFWTPGEQVLWRYRGNGTDAVHIARPVTVVRDDPEVLAVWMAPNTPVVRPVIADGTPVHREPLATRYVKPRTTRVEKWWGAGVLKLARPGDPWSVWLFWDQEWRFRSWYVNLEEPLRRWSGGVDSEDHFLDISVHQDRSWRWLDEDEFAQAQADGLMTAALAARVRQAGLRAIGVIRAWGPPFSDHWQDWRPDPRWPVPALPADWDRPADGSDPLAHDGGEQRSDDPSDGRFGVRPARRSA